MIAEQYYIRKNGKYVPAHNPYALEGLYNGAWLVVVEKGSTIIEQALNPKTAELDAALYYLREELVRAISKSAEAQPPIPISKKEQKAWAKFKRSMGKMGKTGKNMLNMLCHPSYYDIADSGCQRIRKIMLENKMSVDKIKEKYEVKERKIINAIEDLEV